MFLRNCWQVAAFSSEVGFGQPFARTINEEPVVLFRGLSGTLAAAQDRCPHRQAPLSLGRVFGDTLQCGYHGACFDQTGACVKVPGQDVIPVRARLRMYPIVERYGCAWIWMGEAALADAQLVPEVTWLDDPAWVARTGYHHIKANYQLLNDNLLDLSHETYVHGKTIGNSAVAGSPSSVQTVGERVLVSKDMNDCLAPPFYQYTGRLSPEQRVRRWQYTTYRPPGYLVIDVGVEPINPINPNNATDSTKGAIRVGGQVINLITPETATSSHYFWAFARDCRLDESAVTEYLRAAVEQTFDEDKVMLEGQQSRLNHPTQPSFEAAFRGDVGPTHGRRLLARLIEREQSFAARATLIAAPSSVGQ